MKKAINEMLESFLKDDSKKNMTLKHKINNGTKHFNVKLSKGTRGKINFDLSEIEGYQKTYVQKELRKIIRGLVPFNLHSGDVIWTKKSGQYEEGEIYQLAGTTYYYGVNNEKIDCNGWSLDVTVDATYQGTAEGSCVSSEQRTYKLFKLI